MKTERKKIKVMILVNELLRGGAQRIIYDIARNLERGTFGLHVVYLKDHSVFKADVKSFIEEIGSTDTRVTSIGGRQKFSWREFFALWRLLKSEQPDILHTFLPYAGIMGRIAGRLTGARHILSTQCNLPVAYSAKVYWLDRLTLPLADVWTGATEGIEAAYGGSVAYIDSATWEKGRRHYTVVAGADVSRLYQTVAHTDKENKKISLELPKGATVVMMTARLISWKGHSDLIEAISYLRGNVHLLLVGWGPLEDEFKAQAEKLGISSRVHFLGARSDVYELLAIADVYVQAHGYAPNGDVWKGPNTSQMEACAAGIPSVSTKVPLIESLIEDGKTGIVATPNDPKDIARAILWVIEHRDESSRMSVAAKKRVEERYTLSAMIRQYEALYQLLNG